MCGGCDARQKEIDWLRNRLEASEERLLALASPAALAQLRGPQTVVAPPPEEPALKEIVVDDVRYVLVGDRAIRKSDWERVQQGQGFIADDNRFVSQEEHDMALNKLDEMLGGQPSGAGSY
jgi:hypothetical protein